MRVEDAGGGRQKSKPVGNLAIRLTTSAVAVPVLLYLLFLAPPAGFIALVFLASLVAAVEFFTITMPGCRLHQAVGVAATEAVLAAVVYSFYLRMPEILAGSLMALAVTSMLAGLISVDSTGAAASRIAWLLAGPLFLGLLLASLLLLFLREQGARWVVLVMTISWFGDTAAYFTGRSIGRIKLYEKVSPKKTVEGALGGLLGSALAAVLARFWYLPSLPLGEGVALAAAAGFVGQMGDLGESLIKRGAGVKESGFIVPGHGGILDRIDALLLVSAVVWFYSSFFS
jgi:phosphatidate cytidylyltransferase